MDEEEQEQEEELVFESCAWRHHDTKLDDSIFGEDVGGFVGKMVALGLVLDAVNLDRTNRWTHWIGTNNLNLYKHFGKGIFGKFLLLLSACL